MQRFKSSVSLKAAKLSFRRKKKEDKGLEHQDEEDGEEEVSEEKENMEDTRGSPPEERPRSVLRTPPALFAEKERKRRRVDSPQAEAASARPQDLLQRPAEERPPLAAKFGRHIVKEVVTHLTEVRLVMQPDGQGQEEEEEEDDPFFDPPRCVLRGSWATSKVREGDVVHVLADWRDELDAFLVDDSSGLLVVEPDRLVSGTSVVSTLFCMRKAVLNEWFKGLEGTSKTMFIGTLVHELLQESLREKAESRQQVEELVSSSLKRKTVLQDLLFLNMAEDELRKEVEAFLPHILYFTERYVLGKDVQPPAAAFSSSQGRIAASSSSTPTPTVWPGTVEEVSDIEENIWSPRLGVKGKVDLTVKVRMQQSDRRGRKSKVMPLELKTGRASGSAEHRGQVILYSMMMSERRPDPEAGLLLYLRNSSLQEVKAGVHEMRGLVQLRNELVTYLREDVRREEGGEGGGEVQLCALPDPLNLPRACRACPHLLACSLHQRLTSAVPGAPHAMAELAPQATEHLAGAHLDFYRKWSLATTLEKEAKAKTSNLHSIWCQTPQHRERRSLALANLKLEKDSSAATSHVHTFLRSCPALPPVFSVGETVLVSSDSALALSQGVVLEASERRLRVALDRDLRLQHGEDGGDDDKSGDRRFFHLDRYEYQGSLSGSMVNLIRLMSATPEAERLRKIVIDRSPARFTKGLSREVIDVGKKILRALNKVQQKAIFRTLMAEDYILLRGMPGTGKTSLIVALVRVMVGLGKSVLLTSYTHTAVDNILLKLKERQEEEGGGTGGFIRLGRVARIHPNLREFSAERLSESVIDSSALGRLYRECPVVASTCLGVAGHPAVVGRVFDFCVVDEAGQAPLLSVLGPILRAKRFVLVGDPQQLPPVVQSDKAREAGADVSLFAHLEDESEESRNVVPLNVQYRMNSRLTALANGLVYDAFGGLVCGSEEVASRCLQVGKGKLQDTAAARAGNAWIHSALFGGVSSSVVFVDTSSCTGSAFRDSTDGQGVRNEGEADAVLKLCLSLAERCREEALTVGVIAPYRAQVARVRQLLASSGDCGNMEVNTVDQFQGRDKDVILYSCTRSLREDEETAGTSKRKNGDILSDLRRLNVAITRARRKLVMIGNRRTLESYRDTFGKLFTLLEEREFTDITA